MNSLLFALIILYEPKQAIGRDDFIEPQKSINVPLPVSGAKGVIEVKVFGREGCLRNDLVDLACDVSALLGKGSLSFMYVGCQSGKIVSFVIDAEVPWSIRSAAFNEIPLKLLSISRRVSIAFPQQGFSIGWWVNKDRRSENLGLYTIYPNVYEGFTFLDSELVKRGKYPSGCKPGFEEKIVAIIVKRTGLQPFALGFPFIVSCHKEESPMWSFALDLPIENVPPPFIENRIIPHCESLFRDLENVAGNNPQIILLVVRSENIAVGELSYSKGKIKFFRFFSDIETLKRKALISRIEKEEKKREKLEFIIHALQD